MYLLYAFRRSSYGRIGPTQPSRFLADIPKELIRQLPKRGYATVQQASMFTGRSSLGGYGARRALSQQPKPPAAVRGTDGAAPRQATFFAGQRVRHANFGEGVVISSKLVENDEEVTVAFTGKGVRRLLASFARLERVD